MMIKMVVTFTGENVCYLQILDFVFMEKFYSSILPTFYSSYREVPKEKIIKIKTKQHCLQFYRKSYLFIIGMGGNPCFRVS